MDLHVPLNCLKFGQDDGSGINARVAGRLDGIEALAANLFARGQIENLVVKKCDGEYYSVSNGNRRLAAFHLIHGADSDKPIACTLRDVDADGAFEDSLTTAVLAQQLHPVDQYEAFARLEERGKTNEEIAQQYGLSEKQVRQALALGRLSPVIRAAWRAGKIKAGVAQAFTLALDHKRQEKLFAKLSKAGHLYDHLIRRELGASDNDIAELIGFAGDDYRAAGGKVIEDLFGDAHIVSDPALLQKVAADKLAAVCEQLRSEGWSWAGVLSEMPNGARFWPRPQPKELIYEGDEAERLAKLQAALSAAQDGDNFDDEEQDRLTAAIDDIEQPVLRRSFTDRQKAKSGCIVALDNGRLEIIFGLLKPEEVSKKPAAKSKGAAAAAADEPAEPAISNALLHRLSLQLTEAAATALSQDLELAMIILLAGFAAESAAGVRVSVNGLGGSKLDLTGAAELEDNISLLRKMTIQDRVSLLAPIAAAALDFQNHSLDDKSLSNDARAVCNAIKPDALNAALRGAFDAKDYFAGVNKALCLAAITDAMGADVARQQGAKSKKEIADFALANVPPTGWLPVQLRAAGYDGPPVAKSAPVKRGAAAKKAARKTAKAKR